MRYWWIGLPLALTGCVSAPPPQTVLINITVNNTSNTASCSGSYIQRSQETVETPINCQDGRTGNIAINTGPDGYPTLATLSLSDGTTAHAVFSPSAGSRIAHGESANLAAASPAYLASVRAAKTAASRSGNYRTYHRGPRGGCYYTTASGNRQYVDRSYCR